MIKLCLGFLTLSIFLMPGAVIAQDLEISGQGAGSHTKVSREGSRAEIENNVEAGADSGGNSATGNSSDVSIQTGEREVKVTIKNEVNANFTFEEECGCEEEVPVDDPPGNPGGENKPPPIGGEDKPSETKIITTEIITSQVSDDRDPQVLAAISEEVLPATGTWGIALMGLGSAASFLIGSFIRLTHNFDAV